MKLNLFFAFLLLTTINYSQTTNYTKSLKSIKENKTQFQTRYKSAVTKNEKKLVLADAKIFILNSILNTILPQWMGTPWSFEGHSEQPNTGSIACGYFVSTTLNQCGFNINRYKLAQKNPKNEALIIQLDNSIEHFENKSVSEFKSYFLKNKKDGIYFIGLDFHVGYLQKEGEHLYFIHSNYINSEGVVKEEISSSKAFKSSHYYVANITQNDLLIKKWILNEVISTK